MVFFVVVPIFAVFWLKILPDSKDQFIQDKKRELKSVVELAYNIIEIYNKRVVNGELSLAEAQIRAGRDLSQLRFAGKEYFFAYDMQGVTKALGSDSLQIGVNRYEYTDKQGTKIMQRLIDLCKTQGGGYLTYFYPRPGDSVASQKTSYVMYYKPWQWFVGSGLYLDDVNENISIIQNNLIFALLLGLIAAFIIGSLITRAIRKPIRLLSYAAEEVSKGNYSVVIEPASHDEIGQFYNALQRMIKSIRESFEKIRQQEERFRNMFDGHDAIMMLLDPQTGKILSCNPAAEKFYGYSREQFSTFHLSHINSLSAGHIEDNIRMAIDSKQNVFHFRHKLANGEQREVDVYSSPILFDDRTVLFSIVHDVTERVENERKIRLQSAALDSAANLIVITDVRGSIRFVNKAFCKLSGYTAEECIGTTPGKLLNSGRQSHEFYREMWSVILNGEIWEGELINRNKAGHLYYEHMTITPLKDSSNHIDHFIAIKTDITDRKLAEQQLIEAKKKAEELAHVKSSILANMSHEIRTPMIAILGYSEMLQELITEDTPAQMIEKIHLGGKRLLETLNLILDLSQLEAGKYEARIQEVDCTILFQEITDLYKANAERKKLMLECTLPGGPYYFRSDPRIVNQILTNLISNAIKYTNEGKIEVTLIPPEEGKAFLEFRVSDTGIGIPAESLDTIFEEFRQVSEGRGRSFEGIGLGLALTKKFVKKLRGTISVKSLIGKGSEFSVKLPILDDLQIGAGLAVDSPATEGVTGIIRAELVKLLIVEDEIIVSQLLSDYLKGRFDFTIAPDAKSALEKLDESKFDLILMDINLGKGMSGIELTRILRQKTEYRDIPIIAMTAFAMVGDKEEFLEGGCSDYISKPFSRYQLFSIIDKNLSGH